MSNNSFRPILNIVVPSRPLRSSTVTSDLSGIPVTTNRPQAALLLDRTLDGRFRLRSHRGLRLLPSQVTAAALVHRSDLVRCVLSSGKIVWIDAHSGRTFPTKPQVLRLGTAASAVELLADAHRLYSRTRYALTFGAQLHYQLTHRLDLMSDHYVGVSVCWGISAAVLRLDASPLGDYALLAEQSDCVRDVKGRGFAVLYGDDADQGYLLCRRHSGFVAVGPGGLIRPLPPALRLPRGVQNC